MHWGCWGCWVAPVCRRWRELAAQVKGLRVLFQGQQDAEIASFESWIGAHAHQVSTQLLAHPEAVRSSYSASCMPTAVCSSCQKHGCTYCHHCAQSPEPAAVSASMFCHGPACGLPCNPRVLCLQRLGGLGTPHDCSCCFYAYIPYLILSYLILWLAVVL
jgi:hypothetical protein